MLLQPCHVLSQVGPKLSKLLAKCGVITLQDLLFHLPFRYQDRTRITPIRDLRLQDWAVVVGEIVKVTVKTGRRSILECTIKDSNAELKIRFFHFYKNQIESFKVGQIMQVFGEVRKLYPLKEMIHPEYQLAPTGTDLSMEEAFTPIYRVTQGLSQTKLRKLVNQAFIQCEEALHALEWLDDAQLKQHNFYPFHTAIRYLHNPPPETHLAHLEDASHPAIRRLIFEEFLAEQLSMALARKKRGEKRSFACLGNKDLELTFLKNLPFDSTAAQKRVAQEIAVDLTKSKPMLRLVQGDVGSGKTLVAALAILQVVSSGYQAALMAPTDLLSEQHANNFKHWFKDLSINIQHLNGKCSAKNKKEILAELKQGSCHILIGTHALFQEGVNFNKLGLIVIDEQHRFGVMQRLLLEGKGKDKAPHQLLMTATPIPRTLRMTQWAHIDISIIDELPPCRTPVITAVMSGAKREDVFTRLKSAIKEGRQAYWVCTLVEESEKLQCEAAIDTAQILQGALEPFKVGLVHGRIKAEAKEQILTSFKNKELDLLVATTVIEVGVDVPNASLMIIENAERLGLSQLHQLRGRVGRGSKDSYCILLYQHPLSNAGVERLKILRNSNDGFKIAEMDLKLRGSGEVLGTKQAGYRVYKIANIYRDQAILREARQVARELVKTNQQLAIQISQLFQEDRSDFLHG
ncbi:MAG: ATP-dependent DNA helicase RecG [Legionellales bacterium RIFCSPHIGHO2_12_FULL_37_14]|nr:MAG: ATP-dependent DNA helicase RecG [Legionellales bacterium RIFCSPHIGHO2_12_FULL_37_14]